LFVERSIFWVTGRPVSPITPHVIQVAGIYYFVFGVLTVLGGIVGYWKTKRLQPLSVAVICGLTLLVAGGLLSCGETYLMSGLILGMLATAGLSGQFIPQVMTNRAAPQVILMAVLSGIGMLLTLIAFAKK